MGGAVDDKAPAEHVIECVCELFDSIGYTLDALPVGNAALTQVCCRLMDLKRHQLPTGKRAYSKRIDFKIQDVLELRSGGWAKRVFKVSAKTKDAIRLQQQQDLEEDVTGIARAGSEIVVAGKRPAYLSSPGADSGPSRTKSA